MISMPLTGIRVLDLTRLLPGAFCTLVLADMGADVVKVEEPGQGDYMRWMPPLVAGRGAAFDALNRNKRSVTLNLKAAAGRELLLALAERADVLVEGNRPGVMERLGLGFSVLSRRNPRLVVCSITGYGQDGPFAARAGHDLNYMATAGALGLNGAPDGAPAPLSVQVADIGGGGLQPAVAILAALVGVQRGEPGRWIDASMLDGALSWLGPVLAARAAGEEIGRGDSRLGGRYACYRVYRCADGGFYSVAALEPKFWSALCAALGRPELVERQYSEGPGQRELHRIMEEIFATRTRSEWRRLLSDVDACCEPVLGLDEVAEHPQVRARGLLARGGEVAPAIRLSAGWSRRGAPGLGEHNAEVLGEVGVSAAALEELRSAGTV
jgi:crotonobetainyl-CoA:carnitine CoA-transferase CaiB-like acyl-CoA transferase